MKDKEIIAWGCSKLLYFYLHHTPNHNIKYIVDSNPKWHGKEWCKIPIKAPQNIEGYNVVIFTVSSRALQDILGELQQRGMTLGKDVFLYSDFFWNSFSEKVKKITGTSADPHLHAIAKSYYLNSKLNVATTILGNALFVELIRCTTGGISEVGIFNGANTVFGAQFVEGERSFDTFDTFEGFPSLSEHDPAKEIGEMKGDATFESIRDNLSIFPYVSIHKGAVPETFKDIPERKYGLVFYDCDLYQPALDTFDYYWEKMIPGGYIFIHDYFAEEGGYVGVKKATVEFFEGEKIHELWETTGCVIKKPI